MSLPSPSVLQRSHAPYAPGDLAGVAAALRQDGFALIRDAAPPALVAAVRDAVARLRPEAQRGDHGDSGTEYFCTAFDRDPAFLAATTLPGVVDVAEHVLGADCHLITQKAWRTLPGRPDQALHVDQLFVPMPEELCADARWEPPAFILSALLYLDDVDPEFAPTMVVPGSHRSGRSPDQGELTWRGRAAEPVLCRAGDVVIFRCELWHRGSANRSQRMRAVIETDYAQRMVVQKFHPYVGFRPGAATWAAADARQRRLMGEHPIGNYG